MRKLLEKIKKYRERLAELKGKLSPAELEINMGKLKEAEARIRTYYAVADALLRRARERMRNLT